MARRTTTVLILVLLLTFLSPMAGQATSGYTTLGEITATAAPTLSIQLPGRASPADVAGIALYRDGGLLSAGVTFSESEAILAPKGGFASGGSYLVRIFLTSGDRYALTVRTHLYPTFDTTRDVLLRIEAAPEKGFYHPYFLWVPGGLKGTTTRIFVEPNNTGTAAKDLEYHTVFAQRIAEGVHNGGTGREMANELRLPLLVPAFPRELETTSHELTRQIMLVKSGPLARLDLQMTAMIDHARGVLSHNGIEAPQKVFMTGVSSSAHFSIRFALLHPEYVRAFAAGAFNAMPTLPLEEYQGRKLRYPVGIADLPELTGITFDRRAYSEVSQLLFMGALDSHDNVFADDCWDPPDRDVIYELFGTDVVPGRWAKIQSILADQHLSITLHTYSDRGHNTAEFPDLAGFFRKNMN